MTRVQLRDPTPALAPEHAELRRVLDGALRELDGGILAESLCLYRKPPEGAEAGGRPASAWTESERRALYNGALALSSLAGLQYYSSSRKEMRTFYEASTVIDGPDTKKPLADPSFEVPPPELTLYARQRDLTFGDNVYRYTYYARPESLIFIQENMTALSYGIIPVVGKNKLRSVVAVIDAEAYLLIYTASLAKAAALPGMGPRVGRSFTTRAEAILIWYSGQADKAFRGLQPPPPRQP
ncbi:MAG: hypothetical protein LBU28_01580 [Spirochaetaceae bacterium]|nr:hypothetical protein [Spirochaetaceae bacterium]